jgi:hypothetical protein
MLGRKDGVASGLGAMKMIVNTWSTRSSSTNWRAEAYRKLADERAVRLKIATPFKAGSREAQLS